jgi:hypothetical protein
LRDRRESTAGSVAIPAAAFAATAATAAIATTAAATATAAAAAAESTATATAATTTTVPATTTAAATLFARTCFVDGESAATVLVTVERLYGGIGLGIVGHFDKAKTLAAARVAIVDDLCRNNLPVSSEKLLKLRAINAVAQIPHIQLLTHWNLLENGY